MSLFSGKINDVENSVTVIKSYLFLEYPCNFSENLHFESGEIVFGGKCNVPRIKRHIPDLVCQISFSIQLFLSLVLLKMGTGHEKAKEGQITSGNGHPPGSTC